jgi:WD40 repeat protein
LSTLYLIHSLILLLITIVSNTYIGHVVGYAISEIINCASKGSECPIPSCRFVAHDPSQQKNEDESPYSGVTAIACAGEGTSALTTKSMSNLRSTMILTGGADGIVKQYEVLRRKYDNTEDVDLPSWKLEHWPRMPTQRMKRHAHIFKGHYGSVTALASQDGSKILSGGSDGTIRVWNPLKGEELYRMDGFAETISSLCLDREILVTDGMGEFVCVHDFDTTEEELENGYDLDW